MRCSTAVTFGAWGGSSSQKSCFLPPSSARCFTLERWWFRGWAVKAIKDLPVPIYGQSLKRFGRYKQPDPALFTNPGNTMAPPSTASAWATYLPFFKYRYPLVLKCDCALCPYGHKTREPHQADRLAGFTVLLGIVFLGLQVEEYIVAYRDMGLTLGSGIYGSTFFLLTGFHGFHVTMGTFILLVQLFRALKGHFSHKDCFGFEAASWYWHFVDVVWVGLFIFVYVL
ncbi:MAG: hypothetical protein CM15mP68_7240 [Pseudomonadota bacterium]|nr:MAG: hypothetical protein CM15mP68_7240 [Pseudomonadota bacterium]